MEKLNPFKLSEKKYRLYDNIQTDFSEVIDLNQAKDLEKLGIVATVKNNQRIFHFGFPQGFYIIKGFLSIKEQIEVGKACLN